MLTKFALGVVSLALIPATILVAFILTKMWVSAASYFLFKNW
jgi:hypothetical protein